MITAICLLFLFHRLRRWRYRVKLRRLKLASSATNSWIWLMHELQRLDLLGDVIFAPDSLDEIQILDLPEFMAEKILAFAQKIEILEFARHEPLSEVDNAKIWIEAEGIAKDYWRSLTVIQKIRVAFRSESHRAVAFFTVRVRFLN